MKRTSILLIIIFLVNSAIAQQKKHDKMVAPYTPLIVKDMSISLYGKKVDLNKDGFPAMLQTFFNPEMTAISSTPKDLVTEPIHFHVTKASGHKDIKWINNEITFKKNTPEIVSWTTKNTSDSLTMEVNGSIKYDGLLSYQVKFTALNDIDLMQIRLHLPLTPDAAKYVKGLGQKETPRPEQIAWKWDKASKNPGAIWIGDVNGGLQYTLEDSQSKSSSWQNNGNGGITIAQKGKAILADNYSGEHLMKKGDVLYYNFTLLITPAHL